MQNEIVNFDTLKNSILDKGSYLCVGLDPDLSKLPAHLLQSKHSVLEFCKAIIDATHPHCVAYKPNIAFFESMGAQGWEILEEVAAYIPDTHYKIADAKRGDIGNTCKMYARAFFEKMNFDALTVAPYMGEDSITPFLEYENKWVIVLALTSNNGARDFQFIKDQEGRALYENVILQTQRWGNQNNMMYVVGASKSHFIQRVRELAEDFFLLVPGVGAQGGSLHDVSANGLNAHVGLLVNNTREIIYASSGEDFAEVAARKAAEISLEMSGYIKRWVR